jgi:hypothetical protein
MPEFSPYETTEKVYYDVWVLTETRFWELPDTGEERTGRFIVKCVWNRIIHTEREETARARYDEIKCRIRAAEKNHQILKEYDAAITRTISISHPLDGARFMHTETTPDGSIPWGARDPDLREER